MRHGNLVMSLRGVFELPLDTPGLVAGLQQMSCSDKDRELVSFLTV